MVYMLTHSEYSITMKNYKQWGIYMKMDEINKQLAMYSIISKISALFAIMDKQDAERSITQALSWVGQFLEADRAYIFTYDFINETCSNSHEWCERGIVPVMDTLQEVPLKDIPHWVAQHVGNNPLYIDDVSKLKPNDSIRQILEPQGVRSLITIPMYYNRILKGFLGIDSVKHTRKYTEFEQKVLFELSSILANVFQRLDMEERREKEKIRTNFLLEASHIAAWDWDITTNKIKINERWASILGYTLAELEPTTIETWKRLTNPQDLKLAEEMIDKVFSDPNNHYEIDFRMIHKTGKEVWVRDSGKVIEWKNGKPLKMIGTHIDITKIKEKENELRSVTVAVDQSPAAVIITNVDSKIVYVNAFFTALTGYKSEEVIGKNPNILKSNYHKPEYYQALWKTLKQGKSWHGEFQNIKKNGERYWESATISPVFNERDEIVNYVAIKLDITQQKSLENEQINYQKQLEEDLTQRMKELEESQRASVFALAKLTEARDTDTGQHVERIQHLCKTLASAMKNYPEYRNEITPSFMNNLFYSSALHDIGKIRIPDNILLKPGRLNQDEFTLIKQHVKYGADTLAEMIRLFPNNEIILMAAKIARYHHEKWDGSGYLSGLKGTAIPLPARIMAIIDVYDALRSKRPYKEGLSHQQSIDIILEGKGVHFEPLIVDIFINIHEQIEIVYDSML